MPLSIAAICFSTNVGGLELATLRRAAELQAHGHDVVCVLPGAPKLIAHAARMGLRCVAITPSLRYADPVAALRLRRLLDRHNVDVAIVGRTRDLSTVMLAAGRRRAVVLYQQMQSGLDKRDWFHERVFRRLDACIAITDRARNELIENTVLDAERVTTVAYPIDSRRYARAGFENAREQFGIAPDAFVVGIVGRFTPAKGVREYLQALALAAAMDDGFGSRVHGLAVGYQEADASEYMRELEALRNALPLAGRVQFLPFADDTRNAYAAFDVFVLASHCETFGMVLQEAMSMEAAVIGTDCGGVPEIVIDRQTGLLVGPRDVPALADAILEYYRDPDMRRSMIERARKFVVDRYDPDRQYDLFESVLERALNRRRMI